MLLLVASQRLSEILELAVALPREERAELAEQLLDGLSAEGDDRALEIPDSHRQELERRLALDDGPGRPWREVMDELRARRRSNA
jgi:putative addiction module component (TIGR02574 family)